MKVYVSDMRNFVLFWVNGTITAVRARNLVHAIMKAGVPHNHLLSELVRYKLDNKMKQIAGQSNCNCDRQGGPCHHDLKIANLSL
jgi:hypothetical protein